MSRSRALSNLALSIALGAAAPLAAQARIDRAIAQDHKTLEGVVTSVEGETIKLDGGAEIKTDAKTKVTRGGKSARVADLRAGDRVKYALAPGGAAMYVHAEPKR